MLQKIRLFLNPESATDEESLDMLKAMLNSWDADGSQQNVHLSAHNHEEFTRQAFIDDLRPMAKVLENWGNGSLVPSGAGSEVSGQYNKRRVCVCLRDWEVWRDWWWMHVQECFPTFAMSDALQMSYSPRECCSDILVSTDASFHRLCFTSVQYGA